MKWTYKCSVNVEPCPQGDTAAFVKRNAIRYIDDKELGRICIRYTRKNNRISFRIDPWGLLITAPWFVEKEVMLRKLESERPWLVRELKRCRQLWEGEVITPSFQFPGEAFKIRWEEIEKGKRSAELQENTLVIRYPKSIKWLSSTVQIWLERQIETAVIQYAERCLPPRVAELASQHGFTNCHVSVRKLRNAWGHGFSWGFSWGHIELSPYLVFLPSHLCDYVILYELCHTRLGDCDIEDLLNEVTDGKNGSYSIELGHYTPSIFLLRKSCGSDGSQEGRVITPSFQLPGEAFKIRWEKTEDEECSAEWQENTFVIRYPESIEWQSLTVQNMLEKQIEEAVLQYAKRCLPPRLAELARQHGFKYSGVGVWGLYGASGWCWHKERWIELDPFVALLPPHLCDYLLLHELCHTRVRGHGPRFQDFMNKVTDGKYYSYEWEFKRHYTRSIFPLRKTDGRDDSQ